MNDHFFLILKDLNCHYYQPVVAHIANGDAYNNQSLILISYHLYNYRSKYNKYIVLFIRIQEHLKQMIKYFSVCSLKPWNWLIIDSLQNI